MLSSRTDWAGRCSSSASKSPAISLTVESTMARLSVYRRAWISGDTSPSARIMQVIRAGAVMLPR